MNTIRIGNDINVTWKVFTRDGYKYPLDDKILRVWLMSSPFKKEILNFSLKNRNELSFTIDAKEITRYGVYRLLLIVKDADSELVDASFDADYVFQIVSRYYPNFDGDILDGTVDLYPITVLENITGYGKDGESAYEIAVRNGFVGTEQEWLESLKAEIPLYPTTGQNTDGTMTQKAITDKFNELELAGSTITFNASPSVIAEGATTQVALSVAVAGLNEGADLIEILDSSSTVIATGSGNSLSTTVSLSAAATFTARVSLGAATRTASRSVTVAGHIYYGSGTNKSDFVSNRVEYPTPTTSVARTYTVTVRNQGDYVFFQIPSSMSINNVTMGGFGFPMTLQETAGGMKLYRSDNTYLAGNLTLVVS